LWASYYNVGNLLRETADTHGALALQERARQTVDDLLGQALTRLAQGLIEDHRTPNAVPLVRRATDLSDAAAAKDPADARFRFELALAYATMGDAVSDGGAREWRGRSLDVMEELRSSGRLAGGTMDGDEPAKMAEIARKLRGEPRDRAAR
jgi:hypothetical protein